MEIGGRDGEVKAEGVAPCCNGRVAVCERARP